jgi:plasmid maintenance system antidote protein VapI
MSKKLQDERELLTCPGDTLAETLLEKNISEEALTTALGLEKGLLAGIIAGKEPITEETAKLLEQALGIDASFWLKREARYRRILAWIEEQEAREAKNRALFWFLIDRIKRFLSGRL